MFRRLEILRLLERSSEDELLAAQRRSLVDVIRHASDHVPYYQNRVSSRSIGIDNAPDALRRMPVLEKEALQRHPELLTAETWSGRATTKTTGGSTGRPVTIRKDPDAVAQEMATTWLGYGWFGIRVGDACVRFWGRPARNLRRKFRYFAADMATRRKTLSAFGYTRRDLAEYVKKIEHSRPAFLYGYVSVLEDLARYLMQRGEGLHGDYLRLVVTTSEVLSAPQRQVIADAFGVPIQNEYGCGEMGPIAYECPEGSLHLFPTNQYVEILNDENRPVAHGQPGHLIVTDLTNRIMPLVRYRIGDLGRFGDRCRCGRPFPVLGDVFGREYDFVEAPDGRRFHGEFFMYAFEDLRKKSPEIGQFQVVQTDASELLVRVVAQEKSVGTLATIRDELAGRLPGFELQIDFVESLSRQPSGKMRVVENRLRQAAPGQDKAAE